MKVKICGITNLADAICACEAGTDLLGFVFYPPSSRFVPPAEAGQLIRDLQAQPCFQGGHIRTVGLCVNLMPAELAQSAVQAGVDLLQLYGTYQPADLQNLPVGIFKTIRPADYASAQAEARQFADLGQAGDPQLLVDAYEKGAWGGTGKQTDWDIAQRLCARHDRILLAGGLTPDNVGTAIRQVRPWGVDVSSGVEAQPGRKDHDAVRAFIANAKQAGTEAMPPAGQATTTPGA